MTRMSGTVGRMTLPADQIERMTTPLWEQAKEAVDSGDPEAAKQRIDEAVARWRSLQDYSINWVTSLLSFIGREMGEAAVERALRQSGEDFVRRRRADGVDWDSLPAERRRQNHRCRHGWQLWRVRGRRGRREDHVVVPMWQRWALIDEGRYEGEAGYLELTERASHLRPPIGCRCSARTVR